MIPIRKVFLISILVLVFLRGCTIWPHAQTGTPAPIFTVIPTLTILPSSTVLGCQETHGHFEFHSFQTQHMTHPLEFRVFLPPCYGIDESKKYPVLYLLHGQSYNDDQWDRLGADEALDALIASGEVVPFIIVMPRESNYMINQWQSRYAPALAEELIPWMEAHYSVCSQRACRAIGGLSRGAAWAMRIGLIYWQTFGAIGAHSLAPFIGDFNEATIWFRQIPAGKYPRIWIDAGDRDFIKDDAWHFKHRLDEYDVPNEWYVFPGSHTEKYWSAHVSDYLKWYAIAW